jgi:hypothetical protein
MDDLVQSVDQKCCERRCFIGAKVLPEFPQIAGNAFCKIIAVMIAYVIISFAQVGSENARG